MESRVRVLFVRGDDDPTAVSPRVLREESAAFEVDEVASLSMPTLDADAYDCVVCNYALAEGDGVELTAALRDAHPSLPVVVYTSVGDESVARDALRAGAADYVGGASDGAKRPESAEEVTVLERRIREAVAEASRRAADRRELEETAHQLETLTRVLTHDVRNDLSVIVGWADMLRDSVSPEGEEILQRVLSNVRQTLELTDVARDAVAVLVGEGAEGREPTPLEPALRRAVQSRRETFSDATVELGSVPACTVSANSLLESMFRNLLNDALANHPDPAPTIRVTAERDDDVVRVRVAGGAPNPDGRREKAFGDGSLDSPGAGISLSLVRTLVDAYGGSIKVEDEDATVVVELRAPN